MPTSFDENLYTKKLDISQFTPEQIKAAERLAREIEEKAAAALTGPIPSTASVAAHTVTTPSSSSKPRSKGGQNATSKVSQSNSTAAQSTAHPNSQPSKSNDHQNQSQGRPLKSSHSTNSASASAAAASTSTTSGDLSSTAEAKHTDQSQDSQRTKGRSSSGRNVGQGHRPVPVARQINSNPTTSGGGQTSQSKANMRPAVNWPNTGNNAAGTDSKILVTATTPMTARPAKTNGRDKAKAVDKDLEAALIKFHGGKTPATDAAATNNSQKLP